MATGGRTMVAEAASSGRWRISDVRTRMRLSLGHGVCVSVVCEYILCTPTATECVVGVGGAVTVVVGGGGGKGRHRRRQCRRAAGSVRCPRGAPRRPPPLRLSRRADREIVPACTIAVPMIARSRPSDLRFPPRGDV